MDQYLEMLGYKFKDRITGFTGIADSVSFDLYGCVQLSLIPPAVITDRGAEQPNGRWYDTTRLKKVGRKRVMEVPTFERVTGVVEVKDKRRVAPGPANKAPRI